MQDIRLLPWYFLAASNATLSTKISNDYFTRTLCVMFSISCFGPHTTMNVLETPKQQNLHTHR